MVIMSEMLLLSKDAEVVDVRAGNRGGNPGKTCAIISPLLSTIPGRCSTVGTGINDRSASPRIAYSGQNEHLLATTGKTFF